MKILCLDTETISRTPSKHAVLSVGAVAGDIDTGVISEKFSCFVKYPKITDYQITAGAFAVHGITAEQCFNEGLPVEQIQSKLIDIWTNNSCVILAGQNLDFDKRMLAASIYNCDMAEFDANFGYKTLDSNSISLLFLGIDGLKEGFTLKQMCKAWNIDMSKEKEGGTGFHNAIYDSIACFKLLSKFRNTIGKSEELMKRLQA